MPPRFQYDAFAAPPREPSLARALRESPGFSVGALVLAVAGSVVGTVLTSVAGTGQWGTLAGAAVTPVVATTFSTRGAGERGRVRIVAIVLLSLAALITTYLTVLAADKAAGKPVIPGADRDSTFPRPGADKAQPARAVPLVQLSAPACGTVQVGSDRSCDPAVLRYDGPGHLRITRVEIVGENEGDFSAGSDCVGTVLAAGDTCRVPVTFRPSAALPRRATLIVHQTLPPPDTGTKASVTGMGSTQDGQPPLDPDRCVDGYVWREAVSGDHVCVTPETRTQTWQDNAEAADKQVSPEDETCLNGYVWREAVPGDHVCVAPETRSQAQLDNELASDRRVG